MTNRNELVAMELNIKMTYSNEDGTTSTKHPGDIVKVPLDLAEELSVGRKVSDGSFRPKAMLIDPAYELEVEPTVVSVEPKLDGTDGVHKSMKPVARIIKKSKSK